MPNYSLTSRAELDLEEIVIYVVQDNVDAALSLESRLTKIFELLADNPLMGRERWDFGTGLRSFSEGSYLFYRVRAGEVLIARTSRCARPRNDLQLDEITQRRIRDRYRQAAARSECDPSLFIAGIVLGKEPHDGADADGDREFAVFWGIPRP